MASVEVKEAVTETKVVVIEPAVYTLTLSEEEAGALAVLLGETTSDSYYLPNEPWISVYHALSKVLPKPEWRYGAVTTTDGGIEYHPRNQEQDQSAW